MRRSFLWILPWFVLFFCLDRNLFLASGRDQDHVRAVEDDNSFESSCRGFVLISLPRRSRVRQITIASLKDSCEKFVHLREPVHGEELCKGLMVRCFCILLIHHDSEPSSLKDVAMVVLPTDFTTMFGAYLPIFTNARKLFGHFRWMDDWSLVEELCRIEARHSYLLEAFPRRTKHWWAVEL